VTRLIVAAVIATLLFVVAVSLLGGEADGGRLTAGWGSAGPRDVLAAAGFLFFAFAGYARIATLGEEVRDPQRTIARAIPLALGLTIALYAVVAASALLVLGPARLADAAAPLVEAVEQAGLGGWAPGLVRAGAAVATLGVILSLLAGVSRTTFAMAAEGDLPRPLAAVHPRRRVPHVAELAAGAVVVAAVALADLRSAIGFSSVAVLVYYAIANAAAFTLPRDRRTWPRPLSVLGFVGCVALAVSLPVESVVAGFGVLVAGATLYLLRLALRTRASR
jgi:APA family basic amino acid/polyamine antiporter